MKEQEQEIEETLYILITWKLLFRFNLFLLLRSFLIANFDDAMTHRALSRY